MRQNFRETGDVARTNGKAQKLTVKKVVELEDEHGVDFNGDGVYGSESAEIASVLFAGAEGNWGRGLYELDDLSLVVADAELGVGDTPSEIRQLVTSQGDDFSVDGEVLGGYGINRGFAVLYADGARIMRQNFRETGDVARSNGNAKNLTVEQIAELEDEHGVDFNGDSLIGPQIPVVEQVLFDGTQGDSGRSIYLTDNDSLFIGDNLLVEGDEIIDSSRLVDSGAAENYSLDGDLVVGAYGSLQDATLVYFNDENYFTQNFLLNGDIAVASGSRVLVNDNILDMEDLHGIDFNGDGIIFGP